MGWLDDIGGFIGGLFGGGGEAVGGAGGSLSDTLRSAGDVGGSAASGAAEAGAGAGGGLNLSDAAGGLWSGITGAGKGLGDFAKGALPVAQLGLGGLGIATNIRGQQQAADNAKLAREGLQLQERAATPLTNFGESQLRAAQAGSVPQAVQQQIELWKQGAKQKARDYLARAGIGDSSTAADWDAWIDQQGEAMKVSAIQDQSRQGVGALTGAAGAGQGLTQGAAQQQSSLENLIAQSNQMLARLSAGAA